MREFRWQILARWVMAGVLALWAAIAGAWHYLDDVGPLYWVVTAILVYNLLISTTALLRHWPYAVTLASQLLDIVALTIYLHFSGDLENPLTLAYTIPVVAGTVIGTRRAGLLLALTSSLLFLLLVSATLVDAFPVTLRHHHLDLVPELHLTESVDPDLTNHGWGYILAHWSCLTAILVGSAYGFGTLSQRIREKETALQAENERLQLLLSILPEGVVLLNPAGQIVLANLAAERLIGAHSGQALRQLDARLNLADRFSSLVTEYTEYDLGYLDRQLNFILARRTAGGATVLVVRDLTEQHRLMAELMHRSKMADLGMLSAGVAHEIGNPLSSISGILQLIEMRQSAPDISERLRAVRSHVDRMSRILHAMREYGRPSAAQSRVVRIEELLDKALQIVRLHEKSRLMTVEVQIDDRAGTIEAVEDQLVQVLINLLLNAADAAGGTGTIRIAVSTNGEVRIAIQDSGAGLAPADMERLFTPFFTTKSPQKGVGLGLFISDSIVRKHHGRIEVQSTLGRGATFTIHLPRPAPLGKRETAGIL